ncbi:MAG: hypothetical protein AAF198_11595 [Pseudomonadota bacterium]
MIRISVIAMLFAISATCALAQTKTDRALFEECAVTQYQLDDLDDAIYDRGKRLDRIESQLDSFDSTLDNLDWQISVQNGLLAGQPNNSSLLNHYNYLVDQYNYQLNLRENLFRNEYEPTWSSYNRLVDDHSYENDWFERSCLGTWSGSVVSEYCDSPTSKFRLWCDGFN